MSGQNNLAYQFEADLVEHPFNSSSGQRSIQAFENVIGSVTTDELINIAATLDPTLGIQIGGALQTGFHLPAPRAMGSWFERVFAAGIHAVTPQERRDRLRWTFEFGRWPTIIQDLTIGLTLNEALPIREQYAAQAFPRGLLTELHNVDPSLTYRFLALLRPNDFSPPTTSTYVNPYRQPAQRVVDQSMIDPALRTISPATQQPFPRPTTHFFPTPLMSAPVRVSVTAPSPGLPLVPIPRTASTPAPAVDDSPKPTATSSVDVVARYYYCPLCGNKFQSKDFRNLNRHWFNDHHRSNRSASWLQNQREKGALGPWTEDEARMKGKDMKSIRGPEVTRRKKKAGTKQEIALWRSRMQDDPEKWERKAQEEDNYPDYDPSFIDYRRHNVAKGRAKAKEKRKSKDEESEDEEQGNQEQ